MNKSILGRILVGLVAAYRRRQTTHDLLNLNDHLLRDIGIDRGEIWDTVHGRMKSETGLPSDPSAT